MEDETENSSKPVASASVPTPVLGYRSPREEIKRRPSLADIILGAIAAALGAVMLLLCFGFSMNLIARKSYWDVEDRWRFAVIAALLLVGIAWAIRTTWFYFGGWHQTRDQGKSVRKIILPWNWGKENARGSWPRKDRLEL